MVDRHRQFSRNARTMLLLLAAAAALTLTPGQPYAAITRNKLASNKLASNKLASNKLASNGLAQQALSSTRLEATQAAAELLATADGREVYSYIIGCALPDFLSIEADVPGAPDTSPTDNYTCTNGRCSFAGSIGLSPEWVDHKLSAKGQRWVTACLLARVNLHDTAEAISLRGVAPQLTVSQDEAEIYALEEGAFWGNLFDEGPEIDWNACRGRTQAVSEEGGLGLRDCAEPDAADPTRTMCGFKYAGDCADFSPEFANPFACDDFDGSESGYGDCRSIDPMTGRARRYREVITTYAAR